MIPEGHVMLPDGRIVKVLGKLCMTKDGCVAGHGAFLYLKVSNVVIKMTTIMTGSFGHDKQTAAMEPLTARYTSTPPTDEPKKD